MQGPWVSEDQIANMRIGRRGRSGEGGFGAPAQWIRDSSSRPEQNPAAAAAGLSWLAAAVTTHPGPKQQLNFVVVKIWNSLVVTTTSTVLPSLGSDNTAFLSKSHIQKYLVRLDKLSMWRFVGSKQIWVQINFSWLRHFEKRLWNEKLLDIRNILVLIWQLQIDLVSLFVCWGESKKSKNVK